MLTARNNARKEGKRVYYQQNTATLNEKSRVNYKAKHAAIDKRAYERKIEQDRLASEADPAYVAPKRSPAALVRHGLAVASQEPIVLEPSEVIAPHRDISAIAPPAVGRPSRELDVAHPASFKNLVATCYNKAELGAKAVTTAAGYVRCMKQVLVALGHSKPEDVDDVKRSGRPYERPMSNPMWRNEDP